MKFKLLAFYLQSAWNQKLLFFVLIPLLSMLVNLFLQWESLTDPILDATVLDVELTLMGGVPLYFRMMSLLQWVLLIFPFCFMLLDHIKTINQLETLVLSRSSSRCMWWWIKGTSSFCLAAGYIGVLTLFIKILSRFISSFSPDWSEYTHVFFPDLFYSETLPRTLSASFLLLFSTGLLALFGILQTLSLFLKENDVILCLMVFTILFILSLNGIIPRILSPLSYPSTIDLLPQSASYVKYIAFNVIFFMISLLCQSFFIRKIELGRKIRQ